MRRIIIHPWFALADLLLVAVSGCAWILMPQFGIWFTLLALLPCGCRLSAGRVPFQRTRMDWLMLIVLITTWVGYWAAYDKTTAWIKAWLIVTAILLYYALASQPKQNFEALSIISFCLGLGVVVYFFLTFDFSRWGSILRWWMNHRPQLRWHAIHHGYTSGLLVITGLFAVFWFWQREKKPSSQFRSALRIILIFGFGIDLLAFIITMSRGIWAAVVCSLGVWILWRITTADRFIAVSRMRSSFPVIVLLYLGAIIAFVYLGPARAAGDSVPNDFGNNTRAELFGRAAYFLADYPITGGGLNSFPGLYSEYQLVIPYFYFINSYNLFLDVAIEQGIIGGLAVIFIYLWSLWLVSRALVKHESPQTRIFNWLGLFSLIVTIVHGLLYDYLYNGYGTLLIFFPVGMSMAGIVQQNNSEDSMDQLSETPYVFNKSNIRVAILVSVVVMIAILWLQINKIRSLWYANLGAVQMSQVELQHFPSNSWETAEILPQLRLADSTLHSALRFNPDNQTANYRLGLILMLHQDFKSAAAHLEAAHHEAPHHRGIQKSLGYCYAWLGAADQSESLLAEIPEAKKELDVYVWWWETQGRPDLSINAYHQASRLNQP